MKRDDRLRARLKRFLDADEGLRSAFIVGRGDGGVVPFGFRSGILWPRQASYSTVAVTADRVLVLANRGPSRPDRIVETLPITPEVIGEVRGDFDAHIRIGEHEFGVPIPWVDEARRARTATRSSSR